MGDARDGTIYGIFGRKSAHLWPQSPTPYKGEDCLLDTGAVLPGKVVIRQHPRSTQSNQPEHHLICEGLIKKDSCEVWADLVLVTFEEQAGDIHVVPVKELPKKAEQESKSDALVQTGRSEQRVDYNDRTWRPRECNCSSSQARANHGFRTIGCSL